jgi:hypothetical protein
MKGYLAAYDPALKTPSGDYWVWRSARLDRRDVEAHHARIEAEHPFDADNYAPDGEPHGGCLALGSDWCCVYRYFAGGRDRRGRPGRFVLVCCFIPRHVSSVCDPLVLLRQGQFSSIDAEALAQGAQLPRREAAELDVELSVSPACEVESVRAWRSEAEAGKPFHWIIGRGSDVDTSGFRPITPTPDPSGRLDGRSRSNPNLNPALSSEMKASRSVPKPTRISARSWKKQMLKYSAVLLVGHASGLVLEWKTSLLTRTDIPSQANAVNELELRHFLETYRNADGQPYINTNTLLDRLDLRDWSTEQQSQPVARSSGTRHSPDSRRTTPGLSAPSSR